MSSQELIRLLERYAARETSTEEEDRLVELFSNEEYREIILEFLEKHWSQDSGQRLFPTPVSAEKADQLFSTIAVAAHEQMHTKRARIVFFRWTAAAAVVLMLAMSWLLFKDSASSTDPSTRLALTNSNDVAAPDRNLAILAAEDGSRLPLHSVEPGSTDNHEFELRQQNGKRIVDYTIATAAPVNTSNHELLNPRGSKQLILFLSDGTKVVLNAGSRIRYPNYFTGTTRSVELEGEAYFEVAKDKQRPFLVQAKNASIEVLGTHFNVDTHEQQDKVEVTLLEGSVKISKEGSNDILLPGQKAIVSKAIDIMKADTAQAIAWTNDLFNFKGMELKEILNQVSDWYDIAVDGHLHVPEMKLSGIISRDLPLSKILELISMSSGIEIKLKENKIILLNQ
jgi:hypothetical protein